MASSTQCIVNVRLTSYNHYCFVDVCVFIFHFVYNMCKVQRLVASYSFFLHVIIIKFRYIVRRLVQLVNLYIQRRV